MVEKMKESSVKKNIVANFAGKAWASIMSLVFIPLYIKFMGIEAYGLIGIFVSLIAILAILDMGLSSTLSRELARLSASHEADQESRNLVRTLEFVYWGVGLFIGVGFIALAPFIAHYWVKTQGISPQTVQQAVLIMGLVVAFQWPASLYDGGLIGLQQQVLLNSVRSGMATIQHAGAVMVLWLISPSILAYFIWQIFISIMQTLLLAHFVWKSLPVTHEKSVFQQYLLKKNWRFAAGMTGISIMATILTQIDKIILSKLLTLQVFGYYILAVNVGNALSYLVQPVSAALFPKLSQLVLDEDKTKLSSLYHNGCQLVSIILLPAAMTLALFSTEILTLWIRDPEIVRNAYFLMSLIIVGTAINSLMVLPYTLQLAYGWTKLVFSQNVISTILLVPLMIFMVKSYGAVGAPIVWIILNAGYLFILIPLMHRRLLSSEMKKWYLHDIGAPLLIIAGIVLLSRVLMPVDVSKYITLLWLILTPLIAFIITTVSLPSTRAWINWSKLRNFSFSMK
jgi:O-antigen/teichoic acid export membrane protein